MLRSRPEGFQAKTQPGIYEKGVAPLYFRTHGHEEVAEFFGRGGQQYIYLEDLMTLEEGKHSKCGGLGVRVPPPEILYGVDVVQTDPVLFRRAHVLPLSVPRGTKELPTLEQDKDEVLEAVRGGFAAAYDLLAPAIGLNLGVSGQRVAELVLPKMQFPDAEILAQPCTVQGMTIDPPQNVNPPSNDGKVIGKLAGLFGLRHHSPSPPAKPQVQRRKVDGRCKRQDAQTLLMELPGIQSGKLEALADGLRFSRAQV